ncbi:hypothetical protein A5756_01160 [Mycobacterium sp. 852002-53434_SCH5985345]|nr:hypothetical protein A5756_01160 [Mycobacterium sp. 852002-53434_SCH5985345]OBF92412.1 hypothetical protein A5773_20975 [Mycobacterium sp. 852014-52450_SCH5900713]
MIAAACGGVATLALTLGGVGGVIGANVPDTHIDADPSPTVDPAPAAPDDQCCDPVQPQAAGWHCIIGLNCGQIRPRPRSPTPAAPSAPQQ